MNRSYSKKRHIQEVNQRLDTKFLNEKNQEVINEQLTQSMVGGAYAGTVGVIQQMGTWISNVFRGTGIRQSPELRAGFSKVKVWSKTLNMQLKSAETNLDRLWTDGQKDRVQTKITNLSKGAEAQKLQAKDLQNAKNTLDQLVGNIKKQIDDLQKLLSEVIDKTVDEQYSAAEKNQQQGQSQVTNQQGQSQVTQTNQVTTQQK
jgi:hypothetical protein